VIKILGNWIGFLLTVVILLYPVIFKIALTKEIFVHPLELVLLTLWFLVLIYAFINLSFREFLTKNLLIRIYLGLMLVLGIASFYGIFVTKVFDLAEFLRVIKYTLYFVIYPATYLVVQLSKPRFIESMFKWIVYISIIPALYSLYKIAFFADANSDRWLYDINSRSVGFFGQYISPEGIFQTASAAHGVYGLYVSMIILLILVLLLSKTEIAKWKLVGAAMINLLALVFTFARMGWLSVVIGANIIVFRKLGLRSWLIFFSSFVILALFASWVFRSSELVVKFTETIGIGEGGLTLDASSAGRLAAWWEVVKLLGSNPLFYLFGVGYSQANLLILTEGKLRIVHSLFLDLWVRGGLLAFVLGTIIWIRIWKLLREGYRRIADSQVKNVVILAEAFYVPFLIDNLISGQDLFSDALMIYWWFLIGAVTAFISLENKKKVAAHA
jgi:hypothetical protein